MANVYGVNATKNNTPNHQNIIDGAQYGGRVRWMHDSYEASSTASGTVIYLGQKIPSGSYVLPGSIVAHDNLGSANVTVGTIIDGTTDADALVGTTAVNNTTNISLSNTVDTFGTALTGDAQVVVVPDAAITGTIRLSLLYAGK